MSSAERLAASIRKDLEEEVYGALARKLILISTWSDRDALQALRELGYAPLFEGAEVMGAYPGYRLPDDRAGTDVLVFYGASGAEHPGDIYVHIWDERGVCIDGSDRMVDWIRSCIWNDLGERQPDPLSEVDEAAAEVAS